MKTRPILLVAEDDPEDQWLIQHAVDAVCPPEIETHFVEDGVALMDFLQPGNKATNAPHLIVLDLNMPRKDGRTALREIKADPSLAHIPIVILTTSGRDEDARYCQQFGVAGYFRKPNRMSDLHAIFDQLCIEYLQ